MTPRAALLLVTLLLCGAGARAQEADAGPPPLRVMSFNVRYGTAVDGVNGWLHRDDLVVETITRFDPDLLGVQEALAFQMDFLRTKLPGYAALGEGREGGRDGEFSALLVRRDRFELVEHGQFWLSEEPEKVGSRGWDAALPRICTWGRLQDRQAGDRPLVVMNTHFDHRGEEARRESAELVARRLPEKDTPVLVLGDLNSGESSDALKALRGAGLLDTFRVLHPDAGPPGTFHGFRGSRDGNKIDYVLMRGPWSVAEAAIDRHHRGERYPSDHFPVSAVLTWTGPEDGGR